MNALSPAEALADIDRLRRRTRRRARAGAWLPATAIALLVLGSIPLYQAPFSAPAAMHISYPFWAGLADEQRSPVASYLFWFFGAPLVLALTAAWYQFRAGRTGIRVAWRPVIVTGLSVLSVLAVLAAVPRSDISGDPQQLVATPQPVLHLPLTPLLPVAAAVIVLAWAERSRVLMAAGAWMALLTVWLCAAYPPGYLPGWATWALGGFGGASQSGRIGATPRSLRPPHGGPTGDVRGGAPRSTGVAPDAGAAVTESAPRHPALDLDDTVHQRVRLAILTVLSETQECKFGTLRDELELTDGNLNRHLRVLEDAGLLQVIKGYEGRRPCTWLRLTRAGRDALRREITALENLVKRLKGQAGA